MSAYDAIVTKPPAVNFFSRKKKFNQKNRVIHRIKRAVSDSVKIQANELFYISVIIQAEKEEHIKKEDRIFKVKIQAKTIV